MERLASQRPTSQRDLASKVRERSDEGPLAGCARAVFRSSDSVALKGDSTQHKFVLLLIKSADDDSAPSPVWPRSSTTSTTTVMLFVEMPSASHSVAAHTATAGVNGQGR